MGELKFVSPEELAAAETRLTEKLLKDFNEIKRLLEENNKPYIHWGEHLSLQQAMKYTGRSRNCIETWAKEGLIKEAYQIGRSTNKYYSKTDLDNARATWEGKKRKAQAVNLKSIEQSAGILT